MSRALAVDGVCGTDLAAHDVFIANTRLCQHVLISILRLLAVHSERVND